jgi:polysaccharide biosynthesis/export protein
MHIQCSLPASITSLTRPFSTLGLVCLLVCLLTACASTSEKVGQYAVSVPQIKAEQAAAAVAGDGQPVEGAALTYLLQPGDQVDVKFFYNPELNEQLVIGPDNNVALQLIGELNVRGMSVRQLTSELTRRYAVTLRNPQATVILRKYALSRIFVAGEVNNPAAHVLDQSSLTAFQAILQSGGFRKGAERRQVIVLRNSGSGQPLFIKLDLQGHLEQTAESDILLRPYDIVFVPQRRIAEVADFFDEYINKILPIYRNLGFSFTYEMNRKYQSVVP